MKNLEDYIYESYVQSYLIDMVEEGEIWNNIKYNIKRKINNWINKLFGLKDDEFEEKFEPVYQKFQKMSSEEFKDYAKKIFNIKKCLVRFSRKSEIEKIFKYIIPANYEDKIGFYEFDLNKIDFEKSKIISIFSVDNNDKNILYVPCCLIEINGKEYENKTLNIYKLQILTEFNELLDIEKTIELLTTNLEVERIYVEENKNKDLYNKLVNDCKFEKTLGNDSINIAQKIIKKEK